MKPSVQQLIKATQESLREKVVPVVEDQWAASTLRSVDLILSHLHARTQIEGPMLFEDNKELVALMTNLEVPLDGLPEIATKATLFLDRASNVSSEEYPTVDTLAELNILGRGLVDDLLNLCISRPDIAPYAHLHKQLQHYLIRHVEREREFYFPTFVGRPV
jgi:hypothetical protein